LADVLSETAASRICEDERSGLRSAAFEILHQRADYARLLTVLLRHASEAERCEWAVRVGSAIFRTVGPSGVGHLLDTVTPEDIASRPALMLLQASVLREQACLDQALEKARIARALARHLDDWPLFVDASLLLCRVALDIGDLAAVKQALSAFEGTSPSALATSSLCAVNAYMATVESLAGDFDRPDSIWILFSSLLAGLSRPQSRPYSPAIASLRFWACAWASGTAPHNC
jgi:hypothetical protein